MKKTFLYFTIGLLSNANCFATTQVPDYLIYKGDTLMLFSNPLEQFIKNQQLPDSLFRNRLRLSSCARGYIAYWELKNDSLFLTKINKYPYGRDRRIDTINLNNIFNKKGKIFADWVTDTLYSPYGKLLRIEYGYGSAFENNKLFYFKNGILQKTSEYKNIMKYTKYYFNKDKLEKY